LELADAGLLLLSFLAPFLLLVLGLPPYLGLLVRKGRVSDDVHKSPPVKVPEPAGPFLFLGAMTGEIIAAVGFQSWVPVAIMLGSGVAFAIGLWDDLYDLGGKTKPLLLLLAGLAFVGAALLKSNVYQTDLTFPILGDTAPHFFIYTALAVVAFPVVANAFNMMDAFNGEISWFTLLTSLAVLFGVILRELFTTGYSFARVASVLPLVAVATAFLVFNRYPSRAFDGDSGSLMFGAMFAGISIIGGVEIAAMIAIVPAILNSFYTLSSVRGFVERRKMASRPTYIGKDGLLYASPEAGAPTTLTRLVLLAGPLSERDLVKNLVALTAVACLLSAVISVLTWVF